MRILLQVDQQACCTKRILWGRVTQAQGEFKNRRKLRSICASQIWSNPQSPPTMLHVTHTHDFCRDRICGRSQDLRLGSSLTVSDTAASRESSQGRPILRGSSAWLFNVERQLIIRPLHPPVAFQHSSNVPWDWNCQMWCEVHNKGTEVRYDAVIPVDHSFSPLTPQGKWRSKSSEQLVGDIDVHRKDLVRFVWAEMPSARDAQSVLCRYRVAFDRLSW